MVRAARCYFFPHPCLSVLGRTFCSGRTVLGEVYIAYNRTLSWFKTRPGTHESDGWLLQSSRQSATTSSSRKSNSSSGRSDPLWEVSVPHMSALRS
eukprot:1166962-Prorocentrum_minimum.AAC.1